jgi:hypothetical protein
MRSPGEVMGGADGFGGAFANAKMVNGRSRPPDGGRG